MKTHNMISICNIILYTKLNIIVHYSAYSTLFARILDKFTLYLVQRILILRIGARTAPSNGASRNEFSWQHQH